MTPETNPIRPAYGFWETPFSVYAFYGEKGHEGIAIIRKDDAVTAVVTYGIDDSVRQGYAAGHGKDSPLSESDARKLLALPSVAYLTPEGIKALCQHLPPNERNAARAAATAKWESA